MASKTSYQFPTKQEMQNLSRFVLRKKNKNTRELKKKALEWITLAWKEKLNYETNWLGLPIIQNPYDMVRMQEIIFRVKPDWIIETGIAHGGSIIYYASLLELLGKGKVIGVEIDLRAHNRKLLLRHPLARRLVVVEGSSTDHKTISRIKQLVKKNDKVVVILDSNHTQSHVLQELNAYAPFVSRGSYMVACDTIHEFFPKSFFPDRPWGVGNNAYTAVREFLKTHREFVQDRAVEEKFFVTEMPGGFLRRV